MGIPSVVQASLLPGLLGWGRATEMLLLGGRYSAHTMKEWGFLTDVFQPQNEESSIETFAKMISRTTPGAVKMQKELLKVCYFSMAQ